MVGNTLRIQAFLLCALIIAIISAVGLGSAAQAQSKQPNILVLWGDDIGWQNVSAYGMGTMGYTTPNLAR